MAPWFEARGATLRTCRLDLNEALPALNDVDWLIVMGGPMSVNDEAGYPWLVPEKRYISEAIERGCRVLGVCLGGQLIANALGARVYRNTEQEIGWHPVTRTDASADWLPTKFSPLHWHGECFELPDGATPLCHSAITPVQAFRYGSRVLALQFHIEAEQPTVDIFCELETQPLPDTTHVQSLDTMRGNTAAMTESREVLFRLLNSLSNT